MGYICSLCTHFSMTRMLIWQLGQACISTQLTELRGSSRRPSCAATLTTATRRTPRSPMRRGAEGCLRLKFDLDARCDNTERLRRPAQETQGKRANKTVHSCHHAALFLTYVSISLFFVRRFLTDATPGFRNMQRRKPASCTLQRLWATV